jgi:predicted outer membrane protein
MLRRIPRLVRSALVAAILIAVSATVWQSWSAGTPGAGGWTQTEFGPLGPADRNLLVAVRLAGLWEGPTGQQAELQASSADVREVGRKLAQEHTQLDQEVRTVANQLGVLLPSSPNSTQLAWMDDISSRTGSDYDRRFVQIVREAHGNILPAISEVRGKTRNDLVREFAETATEFVTRHHQYLESTGLVDYAALPTPPSPGLLSGVAGAADLVIPIAVFVAAVLGAIALISLLRNRRGQPERITVAPAVASSASSTTTTLPAVSAPVAALPPARKVDRGPTSYSTVTESGAYRIRSETGPQPVVTGGRRRADGTRSRVSDTGAYRVATAEYDPRPLADDSGPYHEESDSGSHRAVDHDSGSHRAADYDSGSHRPAGRTATRSRSRHSVRR